MRKLILMSAALFLFFCAPKALAYTVSVGNDTAARPQLDFYSNFSVIDTNHPASNSGQLTHFKYYAANPNPFRFIIADSNNVVRWVSDQINPAIGIGVYAPPSPVSIQAGWFLGAYFVYSGSIPYAPSGSNASYTPVNSGAPIVGASLHYEYSLARTYSFAAHGETFNYYNYYDYNYNYQNYNYQPSYQSSYQYSYPYSYQAAYPSYQYSYAQPTYSYAYQPNYTYPYYQNQTYSYAPTYTPACLPNNAYNNCSYGLAGYGSNASYYPENNFTYPYTSYQKNYYSKNQYSCY